MEKVVNYEGMFIINSTLGQEVIDKEIEGIKSLIAKYDGTIVEEQKIGIKRLAYEINKLKDGFYYLVYFNLGTEFVQKLEKVFRINDNMLRNLVIVNKLKKNKKSKTSEKKDDIKKEDTAVKQ